MAHGQVRGDRTIKHQASSIIHQAWSTKHLWRSLKASLVPSPLPPASFSRSDLRWCHSRHLPYDWLLVSHHFQRDVRNIFAMLVSPCWIILNPIFHESILSVHIFVCLGLGSLGNRHQSTEIEALHIASWQEFTEFVQPFLVHWCECEQFFVYWCES